MAGVGETYRAPLGAEQRQLIASISLSPIATVVTDARLDDNPIIAVNEAFLRLTGYPEHEVIGRNCRFLRGPDTDQAARHRLGEAVREARPVLVELLNYRKDRSPFMNAVMIAPVFDDAGRPLLFVGSQMDVPAMRAAGEDRSARALELVSRLTRRQRQVLEQLVMGRRNKQIAAALGIGEKTVKLHRAAMLVRLGSPSSADAIRIGVEAGLPAAPDMA